MCKNMHYMINNTGFLFTQGGLTCFPTRSLCTQKLTVKNWLYRLVSKMLMHLVLIRKYSNRIL